MQASMDRQRGHASGEGRARLPTRADPDTPLQRAQRAIGNHAVTALLADVRSPYAAVLVQRDESMQLGQLIRDLIKRSSTSRAERVLAFVGKWGRNASPFSIAKTYLQLHWSGVKYWAEVRKAATKGHQLLTHVDKLERGAHVLKNAVDEQHAAWVQLPSYPLPTGDQANSMKVSQAELDYVERYYNTAAMIANDAMAAKAELGRAIMGWDEVLAQAEAAKDFTRKAVWEAITLLELRFGGPGGFRRYLSESRERASQIEYYCRQSQYLAADMIGKWTPDHYQPPAVTP